MNLSLDGLAAKKPGLPHHPLGMTWAAEKTFATGPSRPPSGAKRTTRPWDSDGIEPKLEAVSV